MKRFTLSFIEKGTRHIIKADVEKEIISLSLVSGWGFIFFGPGGHAKSMLLEAVMRMIAGAKINIKSCHSGLQVDEMKGGISLKALEEEKVIRYNYNYSPLNADILFLEEMFDMPATTGAGFKDWITAKAFRDGNETFQLPLNLVAGVTNREPADVASAGDWIEALVQRFPLQHRSAWASYDSRDYLSLFNAPQSEEASINWDEIIEMQQKAKGLTVSSSVKSILAEMLAKASGKAEKISPRTAMMALAIARAAAVIAGDNEVKKEHLSAIKYLPGLAELGGTIDAEIAAAHERALAEVRMLAVEKRFRELCDELKSASAPIKALQTKKRFLAFRDEAANLTVTDTLTTRRNTLRDAISNKITEAADLADQLTNL